MEIYKDLSRQSLKAGGPRISSGFHECDPQLLPSDSRRVKEPQKIPCSLIPRLLVSLAPLAARLLECKRFFFFVCACQKGGGGWLWSKGFLAETVETGNKNCNLFQHMLYFVKTA